MLQDPISKPPNVQMEVPRGAGTDHNRKNKPSSGNSEQVIKCPRCDSLNTKFCYYNNYSLTQPRHFCKNCRRYWTQGGSLRNVPIGGGCRKNKRVKQRTVDPHLFGGLDDHSSFLQHAATGVAPGSLLSSSCFVGGPPGSGFVDLVNNPMGSDSHLLSMAFSRIQESLRLSTPDQQLSIGGARQFSLMMQQQQQQQHPTTGLYDDAAGLDVSNGYNVKPEHHHVQQMFNGSELFHEHPASNPGVHLGMSLDEHQLCTNFGVQDAGPFSCAGNQGHQLAADAQFKLVQHQRQALALHLGASEHHMQNPTSCSTSTGGAGAVADDSCGMIRSAHLQYVRDPPAERYMDFHHRHLALPDFEDQESPESMNSIIARRGHIHATDKQLVKGSAMNNIGSSSCSAGHQERVESWQQISSSHTEQQQLQLQFAGHGGARKAAVDDQAISTTPSSAGPHEQQAHNISNFWSPSPWSANQDVHTSALL